MDFDALRRDLIEEDYAAYYSAGFGGALVDAFDIERMTNEELLLLAKQRGVDIRKYQQ